MEIKTDTLNHFDGMVYYLEGIAYTPYGAKWHLLDQGTSLNDAVAYLQKLQKEYFDYIRNRVKVKP